MGVGMRLNKQEGGVSRGVVERPLWLLNLVLCISLLPACGAKVEHAKAPPEKIKTFAEVVDEAHCLSCHSPKNHVGPSWKAVAGKYRNVEASAVEAHLISKIAHGGSGAWGRVDMPPYPELSESELREVVRGLLAEGGR